MFVEISAIITSGNIENKESEKGLQTKLITLNEYFRREGISKQIEITKKTQDTQFSKYLGVIELEQPTTLRLNTVSTILKKLNTHLGFESEGNTYVKPYGLTTLKKFSHSTINLRGSMTRLDSTDGEVRVEARIPIPKNYALAIQGRVNVYRSANLNNTLLSKLEHVFQHISLPSLPTDFYNEAWSTNHRGGHFGTKRPTIFADVTFEGKLTKDIESHILNMYEQITDMLVILNVELKNPDRKDIIKKLYDSNITVSNGINPRFEVVELQRRGNISATAGFNPTYLN